MSTQYITAKVRFLEELSRISEQQPSMRSQQIRSAVELRGRFVNVASQG
jgi:hypothetical protein